MEGAGRGTQGYGFTGINAESSQDLKLQESFTNQQTKSISEIKMTGDNHLQNLVMNEVIPTNKRERSQIERARRIISARQMQKLAKGDNLVFLSIVRTNETPIK